MSDSLVVLRWYDWGVTTCDHDDESILLEVERHAIPKARMVSVNEGAENRG